MNRIESLTHSCRDCAPGPHSFAGRFDVAQRTPKAAVCAARLRPQTPRRIRIDHRALRCNDLLRAELIRVLRRSGRYVVSRNVSIPLTVASRLAVQRAKGGYLGLALPCGDACDNLTLDMVVVDERNAWAGGYAFCWGLSHSSRARRRLERQLREAELILLSWMNRTRIQYPLAAVTVGIIDGAADVRQTNDITIALAELDDHFDLPLAHFIAAAIAVSGLVPRHDLRL